jgi:elongator complex protein 3
LDEEIGRSSGSEGYDAALSTILNQLASGGISSRAQLEKAKRNAATTYDLGRYLSNQEILASAKLRIASHSLTILRAHPRRSGSGIIIVTVFSAPFMCPHGTCTFCPGGPREGTPQSYVVDGPSMKPAMGVGFDPYLQTRNNLTKYAKRGHPTSKVELIIEGGTFLALPGDYQIHFVKGTFEGLNGSPSGSLGEAQRINETAQSRCVGLTIESKPDWCEPSHIDRLLDYGVTKLEVGVQCLRNNVLSMSNRGHTSEDSLRAFQFARDAGLKIACHMMPGLPGSSPDDDLDDLRRLFVDELLKPDMMKVYPTLVVKGTALERTYKLGRYEPYNLETVVEILSEMKRFVPDWHRIMRIQREIPENDIAAGVANGNLREIVLQRVNYKGFRCRCIRCREVALDTPAELLCSDDLALRFETYKASGGIEVFISSESRQSNRIAGFARVRFPSEKAHRLEVKSACIVRELRVYGRSIDVGGNPEDAWQHKGLGLTLLEESERWAAEEFGARRMVVTSAVGTRDYYRKLGYERLGPYMSKELR